MRIIPPPDKLAGDLAPVLALAGLPAAATLRIANAAGTVAALEMLEAANMLGAASRLLAYALPRREAVWWACMCARNTAPPDLPQADRAAADVAEEWVRSPTEQLRRTAFRNAEAAGFGSPEAWAAVGAFWSSGSLAPAGQAAVEPPAHVSGAAVAGSVALSAVRGFPDRRDGRLQRFLLSARDIAAGGAGWLVAES